MKNRRWLVAAAFVWTLAGAVALAAYSGRTDSGLILLPDAPHDHASHAGEPHLDPAPALAVEPAGAPAIKRPDVARPKLTQIQWEASFESAMKRAHAEGKPLMIDIYATWCGPCKLLDQEVYTDPDVIAQSGNWVSVKIDGEKRPDVAQAYGVTGYPTILFVESSGKPFAVVPGFEAAPAFAQSMREAYSKWAPSQA